MGFTALYRCKSCGNEFEASEGGGFQFLLFRCVTCDATKSVRKPKPLYMVRQEQELAYASARRAIPDLMYEIRTLDELKAQGKIYAEAYVEHRERASEALKRYQEIVERGPATITSSIRMKCEKCGNESSDSRFCTCCGSALRTELEDANLISREDDLQRIGVCEKCGGQLRDDIGPMCPSCHSRSVEPKKILAAYD